VAALTLRPVTLSHPSTHFTHRASPFVVKLALIPVPIPPLPHPSFAHAHTRTSFQAEQGKQARLVEAANANASLAARVKRRAALSDAPIALVAVETLAPLPDAAQQRIPASSMPNPAASVLNAANGTAPGAAPSATPKSFADIQREEEQNEQRALRVAAMHKPRPQSSSSPAASSSSISASSSSASPLLFSSLVASNKAGKAPAGSPIPVAMPLAFSSSSPLPSLSPSIAPLLPLRSASSTPAAASTPIRMGGSALVFSAGSGSTAAKEPLLRLTPMRSPAVAASSPSLHSSIPTSSPHLSFASSATLVLAPGSGRADASSEQPQSQSTMADYFELALQKQQKSKAKVSPPPKEDAPMITVPRPRPMAPAMAKIMVHMPVTSHYSPPFLRLLSFHRKLWHSIPLLVFRQSFHYHNPPIPLQPYLLPHSISHHHHQDEERAALDAQHARGLIPVAGTFDGSGWAPHLRSAAVPLAALMAHEAAAAAEAADRLLAEQWQAREDEQAATLAREARSKEKQQQQQKQAKQRQQVKPKPVQNQGGPAAEQSGEQASKAQPAQPRPQPRPKQQQPHEQAQTIRQRDRPNQRAPSASPADGAAVSASSADGESIKKSP
jgi:hypothetical protein